MTALPEIVGERNYMLLRARLRFDPMRLNEELIEHPMVLQEACEACVEAIKQRDQLNNYLSFVEAEVSEQLRPAPDGKWRSETMVKSMLPNQPKIMDATVRLEDAKALAGRWTALVESLRAKGSSLKRMAELITVGYMTSNSVYEERKADIQQQRRRPKLGEQSASTS